MRLARRFNGELISADSRQVYKYMNIGTGKDIEKYGRILGYDLVAPDEEFSVSRYVNFAGKAILEIYSQGKLPILVGGTGLYIKGVVDGITTINIPPDEKLRKKLAGISIEELQKKLQEVDPLKFEAMNASDVNNPRRLIRAIEVAKFSKTSKSIKQLNNKDRDVLFIGLKLSKEKLNERIKTRVDERIELGFEKEVEFLKKKGFFGHAPARTLGYKDWPNVDKWKSEEYKYAKRQMTWFKKDSRINWFNVEQRDYEEKIEKLVGTWHNTTDA